MTKNTASGIATYYEGSKKHLDDPVPNNDFPVLYCPGVESSVSGIDWIRSEIICLQLS